MADHADIDHTGLTGISSGAVATDAIWDAAGDLAQGTGANTAAKLGAGLAGQMLRSAGAAAANLWAYPPGYEFDYVEKTSETNITATSEGAADAIITANAVTFDGSTAVWVEAWFPYIQQSGSGTNTSLVFFDGAGSIGLCWIASGPGATGYTGNLRFPGVVARRKLTPSAAAHTYSVRGYVPSGTAIAAAGAGGSAAYMPAYIRVVKA